jgi:WNK lysine deficient protein kinase
LQVDLKRLPSAEKKRIKFETEILKTLHHKHIINFFEVWASPEKDQICFTTEIVTSGTLKEFINGVGKIRLKIIKKWCLQILDGLRYLHSFSIIHRDLKCDNIFVNVRPSLPALIGCQFCAVPNPIALLLLLLLLCSWILTGQYV